MVHFPFQRWRSALSIGHSFLLLLLPPFALDIKAGPSTSHAIPFTSTQHPSCIIYKTPTRDNWPAELRHYSHQNRIRIGCQEWFILKGTVIASFLNPNSAFQWNLPPSNLPQNYISKTIMGVVV